MNHFFETILEILDIIDRHEGSIAMLGIAISVLIFRKEVSNNYVSLEKDNFNEIFKEVMLEKLPRKIEGVEKASEAEWEGRFSELMNELEEMLENANYFKYSMPYFYKYLKEVKEEIGDLERHDNWRLYRNSAKQSQLIEKKCRKMIKAINNVSKGRVFKIKLTQNRVFKALRSYFTKMLIDSPNDRIAETYCASACVGKLNIYELQNHKKQRLAKDLKSLKVGKVLITSSNANIDIIEVKPIISSGRFFFDYKGGIRFGKKIGSIHLNAEVDKLVHRSKKSSGRVLSWNDSNMHKMVVLWREKSDSQMVYYDVLKFRVDKKFAE